MGVRAESQIHAEGLMKWDVYCLPILQKSHARSAIGASR